MYYSNRQKVPGPWALIAVLVFAGMTASSLAQARPGYARVMNMFLSNRLEPGDVEKLARYDLLALDADFPYENPGALNQIKQLNPEIVILAYIPINGTSTIGWERPPETIIHKYFDGCEAGDFWMRDTAGEVVSDWPGKWSTNLTPNSPVNQQGENFGEWFARFVYEEIWEEGNSDWDGILLDDVWKNVSWLNSWIESPIDSDENGQGDDHLALDAWWWQGNFDCVSRLRTLLGPDVPMMANGSNDFHGPLNGVMAENFPFNGHADYDNVYGYSWQRWMFNAEGSYLTALDNFNPSPMQLTTINTYGGGSNAAPDDTPAYHRNKRLCLGSALLGDGYFSIDFSFSDHASLWWEPEFDIYLGAPLGPAYAIDLNGVQVYRRDYEEATVVVNPTNEIHVPTPETPFLVPWDAYIGPRLGVEEEEEVDVIAPNAVQDLAVQSLPGNMVLLTWSAPADFGPTGRSASYDIRYSTSPIERPADWQEATVVHQFLNPKPAGLPQWFTLRGLLPDTRYYIAMRSADEAGNRSPTGNVCAVSLIVPKEPKRPHVETLGAVYPNPTTGGVGISFHAGAVTPVEAEMFDVNGRLLGRLPDRTAIPGQPIRWERLEANGRPVGKGIYFLRIRAGDEVTTRKVQVIR